MTFASAPFRFSRWRILLACVLGAALLLRALGGGATVAPHGDRGLYVNAQSIGCHQDAGPAHAPEHAPDHANCCAFCGASGRDASLAFLFVSVAILFFPPNSQAIARRPLRSELASTPAVGATNAAPRAPPAIS